MRIERKMRTDLALQAEFFAVGWEQQLDRGGVESDAVVEAPNTVRRVKSLDGEHRRQNLCLGDRGRITREQGFDIERLLRFDYEVLHGYTPLDLRQLPTLDMMVELQNTLQHRLSLDSIATATFGVEKTAEGMQAIHWFREGKLMEIAEYCCYDVKLTRLVHEFGVANRMLFYQNRFGKRLSVPVTW